VSGKAAQLTATKALVARALDQREGLPHGGAPRHDAVDSPVAGLGRSTRCRSDGAPLEVCDPQAVLVDDHHLVGASSTQPFTRGGVHRRDECDQARTIGYGSELRKCRTGRFWRACLDHDGVEGG
jgi:hypothetical protein